MCSIPSLLGGGEMPLARQRCSKWHAEATTVAPSRKKAKADHSGLYSKVEQLSTESAQVRSMLTDRQSDTGTPSSKARRIHSR